MFPYNKYLEKKIMKKIVLICMTTLLVTGCASSVRNDVNRYQQEISSSSRSIERLESDIAKSNKDIRVSQSNIVSSKNKISSANSSIKHAENRISSSKQYLSRNRDTYISGRCVMPNLEPKPRPYCESRTKAREHSLSYCSLSVGCDVALIAAGDELDSFSKRFLASEACSIAISGLKNEGYSADTTALNALEALSDTGCKNEGSGFWSGLASLAGCTMSFSIKAAKVQSYINCVDNKADACYSKYTEWRNKPSSKLYKCNQNLSILRKESKNISQHKGVISKQEQHIRKNQKKITALRKKLSNDEKKLSAAKSRLSKYRKLMAKRKKTLAYKIYGSGT